MFQHTGRSCVEGSTDFFTFSQFKGVGDDLRARYCWA